MLSLKRILALYFFIFFVSNLFAQIPGSTDSTFGLGTFNGAVRSIKVQSDGKLIVAGEFTHYKTKLVNHIARLNSDGTLDNTFLTGSGTDFPISSITLQNDGKILLAGYYSTFNGIAANSLVRLNSDGSIDNSFNLGLKLNNYVREVAIQSDGKIVAVGAFTLYDGESQNRIARFNQDGSLDNTFNIGTGANNVTNALAIQPDGRILIGGYFSAFNGIEYNGLVRLNSDGTIDNSLSIGNGFNSGVNTIAVQSNGKILAGGSFTDYNGFPRNRLVRLTSDGAVDFAFIIAAAADDQVNTVALQEDGRILVGGNFLKYNDAPKKYLVCLNTNGTVDNSLDISYGTDNSVCDIEVQPDGKIVIGGYFNKVKNIAKNQIARINLDGTIDNALNSCKGANDLVATISIQKDDKIIVGGGFVTFNDENHNRLLRLNKDGALDNSFNVGEGADSTVNATVIQSDGKIIVGGCFTSFNGTTINRLVRLNVDGTIDNSFAIGLGFNNDVNSLAIQPDGKILIGGIFSSFNGASINRFIRLNSNGSIDNSFNIGSGPSAGAVRTIAIQPDGKILIGGHFGLFNGVSAGYFIRLNPNGSIDNSFLANSVAPVLVIAIQEDGKILVGGLFSTFNGKPTNFIQRLNSNGTTDNSFDTGSGCNAPVYSIVLQPGGKIFIGGIFTLYNGEAAYRVARLNPNGSKDNSFKFGDETGYFVNTLALRTDGNLVVGGTFTKLQNFAINCIALVHGDPNYYNSIKGNIYSDGNKDCKIQSTEEPLSTVIVKALPGPYYGGSDLYGKYQVLVDSGSINYILTQEYNSINSKLFINQCTSSHKVALTGASKDTSSFDFADSLKQCSMLNVAIQNSRMRRCFRNSTYVNYCNYGYQDASSVQIKVVYPSYVVPISSKPMWTSRQDSVLIYDLGTIQSSYCGQILITDSVKCGDETIRGLTQCIKATISPATNCVSQNPAWDRASMKVTGNCQNGTAHFTIKNDGSGNMAGPLEYRVYVNDTLVYFNNYQLKSGQSFTVGYPANGKTIRVEADQHPLHPGKSHPRASVEGCLSNGAVLGTFTPELTAPQDDEDEEIAITCNTIRDSYDPNDKLAFPLGIGATHQIVPGQELEYTIRFQNTGSDTAYTVKVVDTLDVALDVASFTEAVSSHPYRLQVSGKGNAVLTFNFDTINLPDSTTNKLGSMGLVSIRVKVPETTITGTVIKNKAHIYFDYNNPIITNETFHTVDPDIPEDLSKGDKVVVDQVTTGIIDHLSELVKVYPNPSNGKVTVTLPENIGLLQMNVYSMDGVLRKNVTLNEVSEQMVNLEGLKQGTYIYEIKQSDQRIAGGTLVIY